MLLAVLAALEAGRAAASTTKPAALLAVLAALEAGLTAASTPAEPAVIVNLLPEEGVYVKTRGMCTVNYTDSVGLTVPAYSVPPITPHWSIALRIWQRIPSPVTWESDGGSNRGWGGGSSGSYGGLIGYRAQFAMVMHEQIKNVKLAIPDHPGMFHTQSGRDDLMKEFQSSDITPYGGDRADEYDITVIRKNTSLSICANGQRVLEWTDVSYWHPPHIMARLPFSEIDGQVDLGWNTPNFFDPRAGGQPPKPPAFSVPADYLIARHANVSYDSCADAEAALLGPAASNRSIAYAPPRAAGSAANGAPVVYLSSTLGSRVTVDEPTTIHAEATDPDGDVVRLTVIAYGVPPDACDWVQCNSKTMHVTSAADGAGVAEVDFTMRWPLPGRYVVRLIATDYKGDNVAQDVPFFVYKVGDDNRTAECCKYNAEMPVWHARTGLHHKKYTASPPQYQTLHDYGILAAPYPELRLERRTCNGLYYGGPRTTVIWGSYMAKLVGSSTRFILTPTRGTSSEENACDSSNLYQHPTLDYAGVSPTTSGGEACGCTPEGTLLLNVEGLAFDIQNQAYIRYSFGRFSFFHTPDILPQVNEDDILTKVQEFSEATYSEEEVGYPMVHNFYRHYLMYEQMDPGAGMSGVGGGKMSQIAGCDYATGKGNFMITAHEMGHAFDLAHAEMWTETTSTQKTLKDPAASTGRAYTEYMDYWSLMGNGLDYNEMDKRRIEWIEEYETRLWLNADRGAASEEVLTLYPMDRPESKGNLMMLLFELDQGDDILLACDFRAWSGIPLTTTKYGEDGAFGRDDLGRRGSYRANKQGSRAAATPAPATASAGRTSGWTSTSSTATIPTSSRPPRAATRAATR